MPGKRNQPLVIIDADAMIALSNTEDTNYPKAKHILELLTTLQASTLFPTTAICEAVTVLRGRLNKPDEARRIIQNLQRGDLPVQNVDQTILSAAAALYNPRASKKNTLFDAVVAAIAKQVQADAIFSFDQWYPKIGLMLTDELIAEGKHAA